MKRISEPIVFFGSGPVAAASLKLLARDFTVEAVITKPRPPHHKQPFPVLELAHELGIKTFTARTTEEVSRLFRDQPFKSELGIIIDHGIILAPEVIQRFRFGIVNSHFSLLPLWKGADPISFAILSGDAETGVSLMLIAEKLDEGRLIAQERVPIPADATTPRLTERLIAASHELLVRTLPAYIDGKIRPFPQPAIKPTFSRKLTKADGVIDWSKPAERLEREIRAYAGWPRSRAAIAGKQVVITGARVARTAGASGTFKADGGRLLAFCGQDALEITSLIPAGKKEMPAKAFLAGHKLL